MIGQIDLHRSMGWVRSVLSTRTKRNAPALARNKRDAANLHVPNREDRSSREAIPDETKKLQQMTAGYFSMIKQAASCLE